MILPALLPMPHQTAEERGRVKAFVAAARIGIEPDVVLPPYPDKDEQPEFRASDNDAFHRSRGWRVYHYSQTLVYLNAENGRVAYYTDPTAPQGPYNADDTLGPARVTESEAIDLARRFYAAAGWPGDVAVHPFNLRGQRKEVVDFDPNLEVRFVPAFGGIRYDDVWQCVVGVNRQTGQLGFFHPTFRHLPEPPQSLAPRGPLDAARSIALRFGVDVRGESLSESPYRPFALRIWYPPLLDGNRIPAGRAFSPRARAAVAAHRGVLAYVGWLVGGSPASGIGLVVDATTGYVIDTMEPAPTGSAGGGGGSSAAPKKVLDVPTAARPWRVDTGKKGWDAWTAPATATLTPSSSKAVAGKKVLLTDGKAAFPAIYDAKANLLAIDGKAYRPGPALASLLRKRTKQ